jgi:lipid-binding SYLF domain-containing protein
MALGIVFLHTAKAGFIVTGSIGTGLVIARCDDGSWSAPCALATVTVGVGFQVGAEATNYVLILTTRGAVRTFMGKYFAHLALWGITTSKMIDFNAIPGRGQVSLGAEIGVAMGPVGRSAAGANDEFRMTCAIMVSSCIIFLITEIDFRPSSSWSQGCGSNPLLFAQ